MLLSIFPPHNNSQDAVITSTQSSYYFHITAQFFPRWGLYRAAGFCCFFYPLEDEAVNKANEEFVQSYILSKYGLPEYPSAVKSAFSKNGRDYFYITGRPNWIRALFAPVILNWTGKQSTEESSYASKCKVRRHEHFLGCSIWPSHCRLPPIFQSSLHQITVMHVLNTSNVKYNLFIFSCFMHLFVDAGGHGCCKFLASLLYSPANYWASPSHSRLLLSVLISNTWLRCSL